MAIVRIAGKAYDFGEKDWSYLQHKQPDSNHRLQAQVISELSGVEITPEQCMAFLAMHRFIQKSQANQDRENYRGRTWESVVQGSNTLAEKVATGELSGRIVHTPIGVVVEVEEEAPKPKPRRRTPAKAGASRARREDAATEAVAAEQISEI